MCFPFDGLKSLPSSVNNLFTRILFSHEDKYMNTSKSHYCYEGEQRDILLVFSLVISAGFRKGLSVENLLFRREGMAD